LEAIGRVSGPPGVRRSLLHKAFGDERCIRRRISDIRRRRAWFLADVGEQPCLYRGGRPLLLRMIAGEKAGLEDYGTQLGNAAATLDEASYITGAELWVDGGYLAT
jgi:hypothetical protein